MHFAPIGFHFKNVFLYLQIKWKEFGDEKIFTSKLRFQIKLDDYRYGFAFFKKYTDFPFNKKIIK